LKSEISDLPALAVCDVWCRHGFLVGLNSHPGIVGRETMFWNRQVL
jgi:hypothetical protein